MEIALSRACEILARSYRGQTVRIGRKNLIVNGHTLPVRFSPLVPVKSFTLAAQPRQDDIFRFLSGIAQPEQHPLRSQANLGLGFSIKAVYTSVHPHSIYFPTFGFLKNHFIPVNPSPFDLYCNEILRKWIGDHWGQVGKTFEFFNLWQQLVQTAYAFEKLAPPEYDHFFAEHVYQSAGERIIRDAFADPAKRKKFAAFSDFSYEITRARRYLPFVGFMAADPWVRAALEEKQTIRILDVGGGLYTSAQGAPAGRYLIETLQRLFPLKNFELVVTDIHPPQGWRITPEGRPDRKHENVVYHLHDITSGPFRGADGQGFDFVICNRVMTQSPFQQEKIKPGLPPEPAQVERNREAAARFSQARANLYASLRDKRSFLFFDQGQSHWAEVYQKDAAKIDGTHYLKLVLRTDLWFLIARLNLASNPALKDRKFLYRLFTEPGAPVFQWAIAEKYLSTLTDPNRRQALQLWCILEKKNGGPVSQEIKNTIFPAFLQDYGAGQQGVRQKLSDIIDSLANPHTLDLRGLKKLEEALAVAGLNYQVDKRLLLTAKLAFTGLDQLIPAALGLSGSFFDLDGLVEDVKVVAEAATVRKYQASVRFFRSAEPLKARQAMITILPAASGDDFYIVDETANAQK